MPKREGGLCPILDLGPINRALGKRPFRMLTLSRSWRNSPRGLVCVRGFKGRVLSHSDSTASQMVFLNSCQLSGRNTALQYSVLPSGLLWHFQSMQHFPLRSSGRRILNYLDDWLILARSLDTLISHIDSLLIHLESLRLCLNMQRAFSLPPLARSRGDKSPPLARSRRGMRPCLS